MQKMSNDLRNKIKNYIKSKIDVSDLLKDVSISGEDLSYAIVNNFDKSNQDISNCRLTGARIAKANLMCAIAKNVDFSYADLSDSNCRKMVATNANFMRANCKDADLCFADLRGCNLCDITVTFSARYLYKTRLSNNIYGLLGRIWTVVDDSTSMQFSEQR